MRGARRHGGAQFRHRTADCWAAGLATAGYIGLGWRLRRAVGRTERRLFATLNHGSTDVAVLRVPQQLGTPWVLPVLAMAGLLTHRRQLAVTAGLALPVEKATEILGKKAWRRPRPAGVDEQSELRDDAPAEGPSYPSGHAAIAFAAVHLCSPYLSRLAMAAGYAMAGVSAMTRVQQGAHFTGDAVGGAFLGVAVASMLRLICGRSQRSWFERSPA